MYIPSQGGLWLMVLVVLVNTGDGCHAEAEGGLPDTMHARARTVHAWTAAPVIPSSLNGAFTSITPINASLAARGSVGGRARGVASSPSSSLSPTAPPPTVLASLTSARPSDERRRLSGRASSPPLTPLGWTWAGILQAKWTRRSAKLSTCGAALEVCIRLEKKTITFYETCQRRGRLALC